MSTFWTVVTTAVTTGSVNSSLYGMHPLAILSAFLGMMIQATPGGKGVGLMYMIMFIIITVFVVGLMSGRTPEYLGMKITARDVKLVMVAFLIHPLIIIIPTVIAYAGKFTDAISVSGGSLGFTQILYEYTSAAANNGSDFLGTSGNTPFFNVSTGDSHVARTIRSILILLAVAGSMLGRKRLASEAALKNGQLGILVRARGKHNPSCSSYILPISRAWSNTSLLPRTHELLPLSRNDRRTEFQLSEPNNSASMTEQPF